MFVFNRASQLLSLVSFAQWPHLRVPNVQVQDHRCLRGICHELLCELRYWWLFRNWELLWGRTGRVIALHPGLPVTSVTSGVGTASGFRVDFATEQCKQWHTERWFRTDAVHFRPSFLGPFSIQHQQANLLKSFCPTGESYTTVI